MKLPLRSYVIFFTALVAATYGAGHVWRLAANLRAGSANTAETAIGALGALVLLASAVVLGRFMFVLGNASARARAREEEESIDEVRRRDDSGVR